MTYTTKIAIFLVAASACSMGVAGPKVYKCGSTYSQIPCADAVTVDAADSRTKEQKAETEKAAQRDSKAAATMEKTRLKEEKEAADTQKAAAKDAEKAKAKAAEMAAKTAKAASGPGQATNGNTKSKKKEPEFFTATTPPEKKK